MLAVRPCCILSACEAECCILLALWSQTTGRLLLCRTPAAYRAGGGPGTHRSAACPPYSPPIGGARQRAWRAPTHTTRRPTSSPPPKISGCLEGAACPALPASQAVSVPVPDGPVARRTFVRRRLSRWGYVLRARVTTVPGKRVHRPMGDVAVAGTSRPAPRAASCPPQSTASVKRSCQSPSNPTLAG